MFIGRKQELSKLDLLINNKKSNIGIIYGRRRIGKSMLISKALEKHKVLHFEGLENRPKKEQIENFLFQFRLQTGQEIKITGKKTWREIFHLLYKYIENDFHNIVFDEFQWMASYRSEIVSDLKMIWDQYFSKTPNLTIILCGSIASFMSEKVLKSSALYGRTSLTINLKAFHLSETKEMLFNKGFTEILESQLYIGGVPKYLELLLDKSSFVLGIEELAFEKNGYFVEEYEKIFVSHFGKNKDYRKMIQLLAKFPYGLLRYNIIKKTGIKSGGGVTTLLNNLESAGFISSETPFNKSHNSKTIKYFLRDPYLRFYFSFIEPNLKKIKNGNRNIFSMIRQTGEYYSWIGRAFEYLCVDHANKIAKLLGFSGIDYSFGPYFESSRSDKTGIQIDLLFDRADNVITFCEIKHSKSKITKEILPEVEKRAKYLMNKFKRKTIQKVLITTSDVSEETRNYFYKVINVEDFL